MQDNTLSFKLKGELSCGTKDKFTSIMPTNMRNWNTIFKIKKGVDAISWEKEGEMVRNIILL